MLKPDYLISYSLDDFYEVHTMDGQTAEFRFLDHIGTFETLKECVEAITTHDTESGEK